MRRTVLRAGIRTLLAVAIGSAILAVATRYERRLDWTPDARHTLSLGTRDLLSRLPADVSVLAFARRGGDGRERDRLGDLLARYSLETDRISWRLVDPDGEPRLAEEYGVSSDGTVVVEMAERREVVSRADEETITGALARLVRNRTPSVRFLAGHGELSPADRTGGGLSSLAEALAGTGYHVSELQLAVEEPDPAAADLVVLAGPRQDPLPGELNWLGRRLDAGGAVLVLIDPRPLPRLEAFLAERGITARPGVVLDPRTRLFGADASVPVVTDYARHPVTDPLQPGGVVPTFFPVARALDPNGNVPRTTVLARTGGDARVIDADSSGVGPFPVAVLAEGEGALLVIGDSDFVANGNLDLSGNRVFVLSAVEWLARDEDDWIVPPRPVERPRLLTGSEFRRRVTAPVLALPVLFAIGGIVAVSGRRRS